MVRLYYHPSGCMCGCVSENKPVLLAARGDLALLQQIYSHGAGGVNDVLLQRYAGGFDKAVQAVFGADGQHPELSRELRINAGRFGTYKTYDLCQRFEKMRHSGLAEDEFVKRGGALLGAYNGYQRTEYNTLVSRTRSAKQWERFQGEKVLYPNLEWLHTTSAEPRELHLGYVGLVLSMNDPFWQNNQPGNLWGCKCDWRTTDKPATGQPGEVVEPAAGLEGNPAETGELVTERHSYFSRNTSAPGWVNEKAILQLPNDVAYRAVETQYGTYYEHLLYSQKRLSETDLAILKKNRTMATMLLQTGYYKTIRILPGIDKHELLLRERYFGRSYTMGDRFSVNPDAKVDAMIFEFKKCKWGRTSRRILEASKQADRVFIWVEDAVPAIDVERAVRNQWLMRDRENVQTIIIHANGVTRKFNRP